MESPLVSLLKEMMNNKNLSLTKEQRFDLSEDIGVKTIVSIKKPFSVETVACLLKIKLNREIIIAFFYHEENNEYVLVGNNHNDFRVYWRLLQTNGFLTLKEYLNTDNTDYGQYKVIKIYKINSDFDWSIIDDDFEKIVLEVPEEEEVSPVEKFNLISLNNYLLESLLLKIEEKKENLKFIFNQKSRKNPLSKGFWFLSNNDNVIIPFWEGKDEITNQPNIYLEISTKETVSLILDAGNSNIKSLFFEELSTFIPRCRRFREKGVNLNIWSRDYHYRDNKSVNDKIDAFFFDKERIDSFLKLYKKAGNDLGDIDFVDNNIFKLQLERVLTIKKEEEIGLRESFVLEKLKKLKLSYLRLTNIGHFEHLYIEGLEKRVVCFIGENGIGKSTLVRAISLGLVGINETAFVNTKRPELQHLLRIERERGKKIIYSEIGEIEVGYNIGRDYKNIIRLAEGGLKRVAFTDDSNGDFQLTDYKGFLKQLIIGFPQSQGNFNRDYQSVSKETDAALDANVGDLLPLIYNDSDDRLERFSDWLITTYNKASQEKTNNNWQETKMGEVIQKVFNIISELVESEVVFQTVDLDERNVWIKTKEAPNGIILDLISQGFRKVFGWIGYFMMRLSEANPDENDISEAPALVFIDEIATYLHPKWQTKILRVLIDNFPNTQFVITTHSPQVLSSLKEHEVVILKVQQTDEGATVISEDYNTYGADANSILNRVMDTYERPVEIRNRLNELFDLIQEGKTENAKEKLKLLQQEMDKSDPELQRAKMLISTFELLNS